MAAGRRTQGGKSRGGKSHGGTSHGGKASGGTTGRRPAAPSRSRAQTAKTPPQPEPATPAGPFRLGAVAGTTPGKWIDTWRERMPGTALELIPIAGEEQRESLASASVDAALVRLPIERDGLHVIALYDEVPVVVCAADSHLTAADELTIGDLSGEVVIVPGDAALEVKVPGSIPPAFAPPPTTEEAIATVAAGVGVVIVPMSLARLHHRKDADYRVLADGPSSTVALAWRDGDSSPLVDTFVGIVRGRTANSSRG